ncbi:MAG: SH3 domain-containing protein [Chloroflexi bacterium]|nr:SH3 domain-containing protein [Chloroflexota bacterium]
MSENRKQGITALLALILLGSMLLIAIIPATAAQDQPDTIAALTIEDANLRAGPELTYPILAVLPRNTPVILRGRDGNGLWLYGTAGDQRGWVFFSALDPEGDPNGLPVNDELIAPEREDSPTPALTPSITPSLAPAEISATTNDLVNFRSAPSLEAEIIDILPTDSTLTLIGQSADSEWLLANTDEQRGWVFYALVDTDEDLGTLPILTGEEAEVLSTPPAPTATLTPQTVGALPATTNDLVNLRAAPDLSAEILTILPSDSAVEVRGRSQDGTWFFVTAQDDEGWLFYTLVDVAGDPDTLPVVEPLEEEPAATSTSPALETLQGTTNDIVNLRDGPGLDFPVIDILPEATLILLTARTSDGAWLQVSAGDIQGWIFAALVDIPTGNRNDLPVVEE